MAEMIEAIERLLKSDRIDMHSGCILVEPDELAALLEMAKLAEQRIEGDARPLMVPDTMERDS